MKFHQFATAVAGFLMILSVTSLVAQTFLFQSQPEDRAKVGLRFMRPNFEGDSEFSTFSGTYDLWFNVPVVGSRVNIVGAVPFTAFSYGRGGGESGVGNIYVGVQARLGKSPEQGTNMSLGVYLPTASEREFGTNFFGLLTNYHELQRSLPEVLTIYGNFASSYYQINHVMLGVEIGPQLLIPTSERGDGVQLFGHYGLSAGFPLASVAFFAELLGVFRIAGDMGEFGDSFVHSLALGAQLTTSHVRPGLFFLLPLDDEFNDVIDGTLGLKIDFVLN